MPTSRYVWIYPVPFNPLRPPDPERGTFIAVLSELPPGASLEDERTVEWAFVETVEAAIEWGGSRADFVAVGLGHAADQQYAKGLVPDWWPQPSELQPWPGVAAVPTPAGGWGVPTEEEVVASIAEWETRLSGERAELFESAPTGNHLRATFKCEDKDDDGQDIGPVIVFDPNADALVWESPHWMRASDARTLANAKAWQFGLDC